MCRKKGLADLNWESEKPAVVQIIEAIQESGVVIVPRRGNVTVNTLVSREANATEQWREKRELRFVRFAPPVTYKLSD